MYKAILYKEFIKTRAVIIILPTLFAAVAVFSFLQLFEEIRLAGKVSFLETVIQKDTAMFPYFKHLPTFAGVLLASVQYLPEIQYKRLKLTLHLPIKESKTIITMLLYGITIVVTLLLITIAALLIPLAKTFPAEIVNAQFMTLIPHFIAAPAAYLLTTWICIEPTWKFKIPGIIAATYALTFFTMTAKPGAYMPFVPYLIAFVVIAFCFPFLSVARFKEGIQ
ncbi:MAG: hypothetical protein LBF79_03080 [Dysgonamonadaceae bacterium]|jgi:hypothetical protein|nr:hypothetical protein [Dysgonamonadaceae bacterium]